MEVETLGREEAVDTADREMPRRMVAEAKEVADRRMVQQTDGKLSSQRICEV